MVNIGVIMPTLNNKDGGYEALASIKGTDQISWTPIIMDNWRIKRTLSQSWNEGILRAHELGCRVVVVVNDDVLFAPHTLQGLVNSWMERTEGTILVSGVNIRGACERPDDILGYQCPLNSPQQNSEHPDFSCFITGTDILQLVGKFDENFIPAYFEDNDYHRRINLLGYKAINTSWAPYYHYGSVTQHYATNQPAVMPHQFDENKEYYSNKWGGEPGKETYLNPYNDPSVTPAMWLPGMR